MLILALDTYHLMDNTLNCHVSKCYSLIVFFLLSSGASPDSGSDQPDLSSAWAFRLTKSQLNLATLASSLSTSSSLMYMYNGYHAYLVLWYIIINCIHTEFVDRIDGSWEISRGSETAHYSIRTVIRSAYTRTERWEQTATHWYR